ncbi:MAG: hypothetical protein IJN28_06680, partial [Selenomonadales bacterium]|nr:hypothetical protein [Selenomonadales bacterium]
MRELESLGSISILISELKSCIGKLDNDLRNVRNEIGKDHFLSRDVCEDIGQNLHAIVELQTKIYAETDKLQIEIRGKSIGTAEKLIKEQEAKYQKAAYIKTVEMFINELHCMDAEVEKILDEYREEVKTIVTTLSLNEQEQQIEKFVKLKELYELPKNDKLGYIFSNNLNGVYPNNLMTEIIRGSLYLSPNNGGESFGETAVKIAESISSSKAGFENNAQATTEDILEQEAADEQIADEGEAVESQPTVEETNGQTPDTESSSEEESSEEVVLDAKYEGALYSDAIENVFDGTEAVNKVFKAKAVRSEFNGTPMAS